MRNVIRSAAVSMCVIIVGLTTVLRGGPMALQATTTTNASDTTGTPTDTSSTTVTDTSATGTTGTSGTTGATGTTGTTATTGTTDTTADAVASMRDLVDRTRQLIQEAKTSPNPAKITCSWKDATCSSYDLHVNADAISIVEITDLPETRPGLVVVTAGETFKDPLLSANFKDFDHLPPTVSVSVHVGRSILPTFRGGRSLFGTSKAMRSAYTVERLSRLADEAAKAQENKPTTGDTNYTASAKERAEVVDRYVLPNPRRRNAPRLLVEEDFVSIVTTGRSPLLLVRAQAVVPDANSRPQQVVKTFSVNLIYQRWYVDSGGFFAFTTARDQELVREQVENNQTRVLQVRNKGNASTATGISFNVYPGNYPELGLQFGLVHNDGREPSYFLGTTLRLTSIRRLAVMSFSAGLSQTQVRTYPGLQESLAYNNDSKLLDGQLRYTAKPYFAVGISVNLGGTSNAGTNTPPPSTTTAPATTTTP